MNSTAQQVDVGYQKIILLVMLSIFSVVGSMGNCMVIFVFQRVRDKTTAQIFIITMAVIDLFTCMVIIPFTMVVEYIDLNIKYDFFCKLYHFLISSKIPLSAFIMVAIAFDRYFCICHPMKRIMTLRRVKVTLILLFLLACPLGLITSLFYSVYQSIERIDEAKIDAVLGTNFTQSIVDLDKLHIHITLTSTNDADLNSFGKSKKEDYMRESEKILTALRERNVTFKGFTDATFPVIINIVNYGNCDLSAVIVDRKFFEAYQPIHTALWPVCLITVVVLYMMIYRFLCLRRSKKLQQKIIMCAYVNGDGHYESTRLVSGNSEENRKNNKNQNLTTSSNFGTYPVSVSAHELDTNTVVIRTTISGHNAETLLFTEPNAESGKHGNNLLVETTPNKISFNTLSPSTPDHNIPIAKDFYGQSNNNTDNTTDRGRRHSHLTEQRYHWHKNRDSVKRYKGKSKKTKSQLSFETNRLRDENRSANVRTALMLFTVTIVFVVAFVPAMLMARRFIGYNVVVFYIYFIYNVANPFIYAFMNHIFKDYIRQMFTCNDGSGTTKRAPLTALTL